MLVYELAEDKNGTRTYHYYPNGDRTIPGTVEFRPGTDPKLIRKSDIESKLIFGIHALNGIDPTKEKGTIAWY